MATAAFTTLGCKVNQYETQRILESFERAGFSIVPFESAADVYVINSCSVTSAAESKSRYAIRRATRHNPAAKVVVTGCAAQMAINKGQTLDGADVIVPNPEKLDTLSYLFREFPEFEKRASDECSLLRSTGSTRTRATLKIQDGCNVFCSYCSIPFTRPGMRSRDWKEVLEEAQGFAQLGYKEIVLTGVLIGAYGPESGSGGPSFEDLVETLALRSGVPRIRISSIEMRQVTERLIELIISGAVVPHLHIPLQAGNDEVLRDMNRPYSQSDYLKLCDTLYAKIPNMSLSTDVLVGFPTETSERFRSTVEVFRRARYLKAHVFRFSPRFGTPADGWGDRIPDRIKQERSVELSQIAMETAHAHGRHFVGETLRVLVENKMRRDGLLEGLSDNYLSIAFPGPASLRGEIAWVKLTEWNREGGIGELSTEPKSERTRLRVLV